MVKREQVLANRPDNTAFTQQRLPAWQPILSAGIVIPGFVIIGLAFIGIGVALFVTSRSIQVLEVRLWPLTTQRVKCLKERKRETVDVYWVEVNKPLARINIIGHWTVETTVFFPCGLATRIWYDALVFSGGVVSLNGDRYCRYQWLIVTFLGLPSTVRVLRVWINLAMLQVLWLKCQELRVHCGLLHSHTI